MATVTGYVEKIKYRNDENGYSVLNVADGKEEYVLVGTFAYIAEGERIEATGRMVEHSIYGEQLSVESYEIKPPEDTLAIERYLGSGAIKGIGAALAKRIVKKFKADTFRIIEEEPERLSEVKGISERMAMEISSQVEEKRELRQAMLFLQQYGIHMNLAVKIYQQYGQRMYSVIQEIPTSWRTTSMASALRSLMRSRQRWGSLRIPITGYGAGCSMLFCRPLETATPTFPGRSCLPARRSSLRWMRTIWKSISWISRWKKSWW